jgi:hypothetical protein
MSEAERYKIMALQCRDMAARAYEEGWQEALIHMAEDFEAEAEPIDQEMNERPPTAK